jgi:hypothetical protein
MKQVFCLCRKEHRLRVPETKMLMRIFGPKREEMAGGQRKVHDQTFLRL